MSAISTTIPAVEHALSHGELEHNAVLERVMAVGRENLVSELARLKSLGIIDENGTLLKTELPPDMQPGADRDFGG